jgi:hypothetical protein
MQISVWGQMLFADVKAATRKTVPELDPIKT